ncbi:GIY-YIG nuclease family protein [Xanthobacteraceae bacterium A53D]
MLHEILRPVGVPLNFGPLPTADLQQNDLRERLAPTEARLQYVTALLAPMLRAKPAITRNAWYAAGRLLGGCGMTARSGKECDGSPALAEMLVRMMVRHRSLEAVQQARLPSAPLMAGPLPPKSVGIIYFAKTGGAETLKIGFTTSLARRMRELKFETGHEHLVEAWFVGTMVDEAVARIALAERQIKGDWFFIGDPADRQVAGFVPRRAAAPSISTEAVQ